ncbi:MAG: signal peptidase II [Cyanobacteriota bacterium]|jgi:signal peptidase II|nr:signal peptidase II [Cyanobacteriota bacterium]
MSSHRGVARNGRSGARLQVYGLAATVVIADQLSKAWAVKELAGGPKPLLPGLLDLVLTYNTGAAFSLFSGGARLLGLVSLLVATAGVIWIQRQEVLPPRRLLGAAFLLGGAIGNGLDRWRSGAVVDFLALVPIHFPVFNLADVAINLAVLCFVIDLLKNRQRSDSS